MIAAPTDRWKLGLFVVIGLTVGLGSLFWIGAQRLNRDSVQIVTYFQEPVGGLEEGSAVKMRGVSVGIVDTITIAPDRRSVEVRANIFSDVLEMLGVSPEGTGTGRIGPDDLRTQVAMAGITGTKYVLVDFFPPDEHPLPRWLEAGVKVCVCTDNTLLSAVDAGEELRRAGAIPGMNETLLERVVATGHEAAFARGSGADAPRAARLYWAPGSCDAEDTMALCATAFCNLSWSEHCQLKVVETGAVSAVVMDTDLAKAVTSDHPSNVGISLVGLAEVFDDSFIDKAEIP